VRLFVVTATVGLLGATILAAAVPGGDPASTLPEPASTPAPQPASATQPPSEADFVRHAARLRQRVPGGQFTIVIERPFVVIGDEPPEVVEHRAKRTIRWAVDMLKKSYFRKDPAEILEIWLFKDEASYRKNAAALFDTQPTTPYGYYSHADRALVMNIATGGGTLVHEIVHPFVAANFPACPSWLNEGLGSLYEQSEERDGRIHGRTNWRLAGLQEAIRQKRVPKFETLCSTTSKQFYEEDRGTNYAQARYLCYYLQEHGLLEKYYHRFVTRQKDDPTGYATLRTILGEPDMAEFQRRWENYVLGLRFP